MTQLSNKPKKVMPVYSGKPIPARDVLINRYEEQHMSVSEIGKEFNVAGGTVARWLKTNDIPLRKPISFESDLINQKRLIAIRAKLESGGGKLELKCEYCSTVFFTYPSQKRIYCNRSCYMQHKKKWKNMEETLSRTRKKNSAGNMEGKQPVAFNQHGEPVTTVKMSITFDPKHAVFIKSQKGGASAYIRKLISADLINTPQKHFNPSR